jgi:type I restriction enzyme S subunit
MSEWRRVHLRDVVNNASRSFDFREKSAVIFINTGDVLNGQFLHCDLSEVETLPGQAKKAIRRGDILYSEIRPGNGRHSLVRGVLNEYVVSTKFMVLESGSDVLPEFLYHVLKSPACEAAFKLIAESRSGTFPQITFDSVGHYEFQLPSQPEQQAIAYILGTFDDKIELNRRMNETLEAMARAIFQSWFVDFDPVRAKASGASTDSICQRLSLTPELLALFPDSFEDSELGDIPLGWRVSPLGELSSYLSRGLSPKYLEEGGVCVLNQKCIRNGKVSTASARRHDPAQRSIAGRELTKGDILVNSTGTGTLGRVAQVMALEEPTIVDSHVTVVRANQIACAPSYLCLTLMERQAEIEALGEGSTGQTELSRARLAALKVLTPPVSLMNAFDVRIEAFREASSRNDRQNITLAATRDSILPRLLSGELLTSEATA